MRQIHPDITRFSIFGLVEPEICAILTHMVRYCLIAFAFSLTSVASADNAAHRIAFTEGRYIEAAQSLNAASDSADALAFSARCHLAEAMSAEDHIPPQHTVLEAERLARRALEYAPNHIEGRLQLAIALSLRARPLSTRQAMSAGYASDAKNLALDVLEDDPTNPYANGFLAVWNIEVVRRGGGLGASIMGASLKKARRHYATALLQHSDDASTHWQFAKALTALNARKHRNEIETALEAALSATAETELERVMQARAATLYDALQTLPRRDVQRLAEQML